MRTVLIGGGTLKSTKLFNRIMIRMSHKKNPKVLFIGTASNDSNEYYLEVKDAFTRLGCSVDNLSLVTNNYSEKELDSIFDVDIIYIGGGDTVFMLNKWHECGIDKRILDILYQDKAVVGGLSAGCGVFFKYIYSDSNGKIIKDGSFRMQKMLGVYDGILCPHYNNPLRKNFSLDLVNYDYKGLALEDEVAFVNEDSKYYLVRSRRDAKAFCFTYKEGKLVKDELSFLE